MIDSTKTLDELGGLCDHVAQYQGSEMSRVVIKMLDALIESYMCDLVRCLPDELLKKQALIQQSMALKRVFEGDSGSLPKVS